MKKWTLLTLYLLTTVSYSAPFNIAYVEVNNNELSNAACFINEKDQPIFNFVGIFAANINGQDPNTPYVYFNPQVDKLLNQTDQVSKLQSQGIKVLLTLLGNHENAGWSCMTSEKAIQRFANEVVDITVKYHLDGVDIDDEYSNCATNDSSLIRITHAIKQHPKFKGKYLTKALFADQQYFQAAYKGMKLADFLDYGWEMSYGGNPEHRLQPYLGYGMQKQILALGISTSSGSQSASEATKYIMTHHFGGMMIYNVKKNSFDVMKAVAENENKALRLKPNCLR